MNPLKSFIEAIYECFEIEIPDPEEEQKLPPMDVMGVVCQELLNISCMREEGRFLSFRVCFISPDSELLGAYIYAHPLVFQNPVKFSSGKIHKLAPALNADMSYLMLDISKKPFMATGIIVAYTAWEKILTGEVVSGNRMPRIPNILVSAPGELKACIGEVPVVCYSFGRCIYTRLNTFFSMPVVEKLRINARIADKEYYQVIYRVIWNMISYGHGGTLLFVSSAEECENYLDMKYQMPVQFLFENDQGPGKLIGVKFEKELITYSDMISKISSVDGSVVLTKRLDLLGFGAEILIDKMDRKEPEMCFIGQDGKVDPFKHFKDQGMRHRAGYRFCNVVEGSVAIIVSQDGSIECCTKEDGKVVVYDNVALPMF